MNKRNSTKQKIIKIMGRRDYVNYKDLKSLCFSQSTLRYAINELLEEKIIKRVSCGVYILNNKKLPVSLSKDIKNLKEHPEIYKKITEKYSLGFRVKRILRDIQNEFNIHFRFFRVLYKNLRQELRKIDIIKNSINDKLFKDETSLVIPSGRIWNGHLWFNLDPLRKLIRKKKRIYWVRVYFNFNYTKAFIKRVEKSSCKVYIGKSRNEFALRVSVKRIVPKKLQKHKLLSVCLNPQEFDLSDVNCISDKDARKLYGELKKFGFFLILRSTNRNELADLIVKTPSGGTAIIEITSRFSSSNNSELFFKRYFLAGKLICQLLSAENNIKISAKKIAVTTNSQNVITPNIYSILEELGINVIQTSFGNGWAKSVAEKISTICG